MELLADIGIPGLLVTGTVVFIGAVIQGSVGMGFGLFAAPILAIIDPRLIPGLILTLGIFAASLPAIRGRKQIVRKELGLGIVGRIVGAIGAGAAFGAITDFQTLSLVFGVIIALAVILSLTPFEVAFNDTNLFVASIVSGVMGTFTGIGAPPMGILYQHQNATKIRATLNAFFALGALISFVALMSYGAIGTGHFLVAAAVSPALLLGIFTASLIKTPPGQGLRSIVLGICAISSAVLILRGLGYA